MQLFNLYFNNNNEFNLFNEAEIIFEIKKI